MFDSIVVPLDGSRVAAYALPYATALAEAFGSRLTLVSVITPRLKDLGTGDVFGLTTGVRREADQRAMANATAFLESVAAPLRARGVACEYALHHGNPAEEIIACAGKDASTLIVMSTHGYTGFKRLRLGGVAQHVVRHAAVPTFVVRAPEHGAHRETATCKEVTVTLDGSPLAETALPVATRLAEAFGVPLVLLTILPSIVYPTSSYDTEFTPSTIEQEEADQRGAEAYLAATAARLATPTLPVETVWRRGIAARPEEAISEYLSERPEGIVVMASHGRGGVLGWAIGSTADGMITRAPCPVLIVRAGTAPPAREAARAAHAGRAG